VNFAELHSYYMSLRIDSHITDLNSKGELFGYPKDHRLMVEKGFIYFIVDGSVAIAGKDNELIAGNTIEYMPIGLMERYCPLVAFDYIAMTPISVIKISWENFDAIFFNSDPQRLTELTTILVYMTIFSLDLHYERKQLTSYQTIKPMLSRYLYRSQTHKNEREGIAAFIMRRTNLSRTHVFRVLADLKEGGYITVEKGKLVSINKSLPEEY